MELYMMNRQNGRMILESVENGLLLWPTIEENEMTRPKKYSELSATEAIQADCDVKATNIILQGLPPKERECKFYDEFDKFAYKKGESLREFYLIFSLILNDMNIYNMKLEQFQVKTKFLNTLPPEWSKFVTDVKLVRLLHKCNSDPLALVVTLQMTIFSKGDDPIDAINHMMSFLTIVVTSRYPPTNNQLRISPNSRQQATINNRRVTVQPIHGRHTSLAVGEGHMSKQCTKPKRKRDESWFKDKVLLVQAQANEQILHEEELAFLADPRLQKLKPHKMSSPTMPLIKPMIWMPMTLIVMKSILPMLHSWRIYLTMVPMILLRPTKVEVPKELPMVSMVNTSLKKLIHHLASFDVLVKERTTVTTITKGTWGFKHTKACFRDEIIPFLKALKDLFNLFDQFLIDELSEVQNVFYQMKQAVEQHRVESKGFQEAVATACYIQNHSIVHLRHGKIPYELLHGKLPDLSFLHVFGALCYPTNDSENLGKLQPKADICIFIGYAPTKKAFWIYNRRTRRIIETIHVDFDELTAMASEQSSSGLALHEMTPATISSGLVPKPTSSTPFVPPSRNNWDLLFQQLFDELLTPPLSVDPPAPEVIALIDEVIAPEPAESTGSPSSTTVEQDAPSPGKSQTTPETQPPVIPHDVEEDNHDIEVAHMGNDSFFGMPIPKVASDQSSSTNSNHAIVHPDHQISQHNSKWTNDHPLENIIGQLA
nr:hypothetical protein [Tanacetum cinerariifolium]